MTTKRLQSWLSSRQLLEHSTSVDEVARLLAVVDRDMRDAEVAGLSPDRRFAIAYSAALALATIVLAASGYRAVAQRGHHRVAIAALTEFIGPSVASFARYLDSCRQRRNQGDYERIDVVSDTEAVELLAEARAFRPTVLDWLAREHPELVPGR